MPWLSEAIDSVLAQGLRDFELILVDDGSSDGSTQLALEYARRHPDRVRYVEHPDHANRGASAARNLGVAAARADLIAFIDADDVWLPDKLERQVGVFELHPEIAMVADGALYWSSWQKEAGEPDRFVLAGAVQDRVVPAPEAALRVYPLGTAQAPCPSGMMVRRDALQAVGGFEESFRGVYQLYEDQVILMKLYLEYPVWFSSVCGCQYRLHADSCMSRVAREGRYHTVRLHFLEWLEGYLKQRPVTDGRLDRAVQRAMWRYRHPRLLACLRPVLAVRDLLARALRKLSS